MLDPKHPRVLQHNGSEIRKVLAVALETVNHALRIERPVAWSRVDGMPRLPLVLRIGFRDAITDRAGRPPAEKTVSACLGAGPPRWHSPGTLTAVTRFEFRVTDVFDIRGCRGLLVVGTVLQGIARSSTRLRDVSTGHSFGLLGIDLHCSRSPDMSGFALVVDRAERDYAQPGRVWVADVEP
ncbi:hypothetical protein GCM10023176_54200 [Micromonospora coerulea]|uniref:Uncharacterized protein n=1 Tax=Micromonospora coerulea TaxID=47856 RepID=A0ABP8T2E9_9ACTN